MYIVGIVGRGGISVTSIRAFSSTQNLINWISDRREILIRDELRRLDNYNSESYRHWSPTQLQSVIDSSTTLIQHLRGQTLRDFINPQTSQRFYAGRAFAPCKANSIMFCPPDLPSYNTERPNTRMTGDLLVQRAITDAVYLDGLPRT